MSPWVAICFQGKPLLGVMQLLVSDLMACESEPLGCDLLSRETFVGSDAIASE